MIVMLGAILHITDIQFDHDYDTDGVYIVQEDMLEMGSYVLRSCVVLPSSRILSFLLRKMEDLWCCVLQPRSCWE